ncbi:hypothetical protein [Galactobacillus timonensis]|uniref:hypothetical protein n=1 Tax=Galactobacillus timonensis TaxID=2041840 RepID=UPI001436C9E6|nr:hypothetical protein [Galactobacillus timonensis]
MAKNNEEKISIKKQFVALDKSMKGVKKVGPYAAAAGVVVLTAIGNKDNTDGGSNA